MNEEHFCMCPTLEELPDADQSLLKQRRAALLRSARWQPNDQIKIRFLEGSPALQQRVKKVASEWLKFAGLKFDFVQNGQSDVRIAFQPGKGSWSYLGTICRQIPEPRPTMNYGWLKDDSADAELRRVVLHEFGHALGLIHEHQNPKGAVQWNKPAVIQDLSGPPNNWDESTIENNMFRFYAPGEVLATKVDADSIMMYPIPKAWTLDGFSADLNSELSENDKVLIRTAYPT